MHATRQWATRLHNLQKIEIPLSLQKSTRTQEEDKPVTVIAEVLATPVEVTLLDDVAEGSEEPDEEPVENLQDTLSEVVVAEDAHPAEQEVVNGELFSVVDINVQELGMAVDHPLEPLAPGLPEEDDLADAHEAEVVAFAGLEAPVEMHENPQ